MTAWILAVIALYIVYTLLPGWIAVGASEDPARRAVELLGPRDGEPPKSIYSERARRALGNLQEAMPVFVTLALLAMVQGEVQADRARWGAAAFFVARVLYLPAYLSGITGLRSAIWSVSFGGLGWMAWVVWS